MKPHEIRQLRAAFKAEAKIDMAALKADMVTLPKVDIRMRQTKDRRTAPHLIIFSDEEAYAVEVDRSILKKLKARFEQESRLWKMGCAGDKEPVGAHGFSALTGAT